MLTQRSQEMDDEKNLFSVTLSEENLRLDRFLSDMSGLSRARIQAFIKEGAVEDRGQCITDPARKTKHGQIYTMQIPDPEPLFLIPEPMGLNIVYEDEHLLVINKPPHLVVHPGPGHATGTLVHGLLAHCGESLSGIGGVRRPGIVHRLDKGTSGLLVVAKNDESHQGLSAQFASKTLYRQYWAFIWGTPHPLQDTICLPIGRHPTSRQRQAVVSRGREAITHYRVKKIYAHGLLSFIECRLETGRTHQIRVHLQARRAPLLQDPLYGKTPARLPDTLKNFLKNDWSDNRPALHAHTLSFKHPVSHQELCFEAPLPHDLMALQNLSEALL